MNNFWQFIAEIAVYLGQNIAGVALVTAVVSFVVALVMQRLWQRILQHERWVRYLAWGFFIFFIQYIMYLGYLNMPPNHLWLALWGLVDSAASPLNTLCFLAAARSLSHRVAPQAALPPWAWPMAVIVFLCDWMYIPGLAHQLPDTLFSLMVLVYLGLAMYQYFRERIVSMGIVYLLGATFYGIFQVINGLIPLIIANGTSFNLTTHIRAIVVERITNNPLLSLSGELVLQGLSASILLVFKLGLFFSAFLLVQKCLAVLAPDIQGILNKATRGNTEFLSSRGVLEHLGVTVDADLVSLHILLPGKTRRVRRLLWLRDDTENRDEEDQPLGPGPQQVSLVHQVLATGRAHEFRSRTEQQPELQLKNHPSTDVSVVAQPILYNNSVIGCINCEWKKGLAFTATMTRRIQQTASLLSSSLHGKRQLFALGSLNQQLDGFNRQGTGSFLTVMDRINDLLTPHGTGIFLDMGFKRTCVFTDRSGKVRLTDDCDLNTFKDKIREAHQSQEITFLSLPLQQSVAKGFHTVGVFFHTTISGDDEADESILLRNDVFREMVARAILGIYLDSVHSEFSLRLNQLGTDLDRVETHEGWWKHLYEVIIGAGTLWACAHLQTGEFLGDRDKEQQLRDDFAFPALQEGDTVKIQPDMIALRLKNARAGLYLGFSRSIQPAEFYLKHSPWFFFLEALAAQADSSLTRIMSHKLELAIARVETPALLVHELRKQASRLSLGLRNVEEDLTINPEEARDSLRTLQELSKNFINLSLTLNQPIEADERNPFSLGFAIEKVAERYDRWLENRHIELVVNIGGSWRVAAPLDTFCLVLSTLLSNAADAIRHQGTIVIDTEEKDGMVLCHVTNDGPEIPEEEREKIFELGYTTKEKSSGLGLSLSRNWLRRSQGMLRLAWSKAGQTRFTISLPKHRVREDVDE